MEYAEYINFYLQIRNQLEEIRNNDISGQVTLDNIYMYFFNELENYTLDDKTSLEVLTNVMIQNKISFDIEEGKLKKTYANYLKVREFLKTEEEKYRYELLKINVKNYFEDNPEMCNFSLINFEKIIEETLKVIDGYDEIFLDYYQYYFSLEKTISLIESFFNEVDTSKRLSNIFKEFLNDENVFIWDKNDEEKYNLLRKSKLAKSCPYCDFYDGFVSRINNEIFVNVYCRNNLLDSYNIIHEFIHYYIVKEIKLDEESESSKFFAEFPSIFFEYLFNMYLEDCALFEFDRDIDIMERKVEVIKNVFMISSTCKLYNAISKGNVEFSDFYQEYSNSLEFKNYEDKASHIYLELTEQIYDMDMFCDVININISEIDYSNIISYVSATLFSEELIRLIRNGKMYLVNRLIDVMDSLAYTSMDPKYILSYLELDYRFFGFEQVSENVVPKRLEKIR